MEESAGEHFRSLRKYPVYRLVHALLAGAQYLGVYPEPTRHLGRLAGARKFGISGDDRTRVSGHVYLRHDLDKPLRGIVHDLLDLRLGVIAADGFAVAARPLALATYLVQLGHGVYAQTEALVVADVEVEIIELEERHGVDELLHRIHAEKVAAHVDHSRTVGVARFVVHRTRGQIRLQRASRELQECHGGMEEPLVVLRQRGDSLRSDLQHVIPLRFALRKFHGR